MSRRKISLVILSLLILVLPRLSAGSIEFISTHSVLPSGNASELFFSGNRFQFSSDGKRFSVHLSGTSVSAAGTDLMDPAISVLDYGYVRLRSRMFRTSLSLGRIPLNEALTNEAIDGIYARTGAPGKASLSVFSGRVSGTGEDLFGGRLAYSLNDRASAGLSYLQTWLDTQSVGEDAALDLGIRPFRRVALSGRSIIDLSKGAWDEQSYEATIGPLLNTTFRLDAGWSDPDASRSLLEPPNLGGALEVAISPHASVGFEMRRADDPVEGQLVSRGLHVSCSPMPGWNTGISFVRTAGETFTRTEAGIQAGKIDGNLEGSLSLQQTMPASDSGPDQQTAARLGFSYSLSPEYRVISDVQTTLPSERGPDVSAFVKLEYRFGT